MNNWYFTSEAISMGHPDKIADQISDAILDAHLQQDPQARVACETLIKDQLLVIAGEITSQAKVDHEKVAKDVLNKIGYDNSVFGLDVDKLKVTSCINQQSNEIASGVFKESPEKLGAGDQGIMFGFACDETPTYMPLPFVLSNLVLNALNNARIQKKLPYLGPDAKSQVTVLYEHPFVPKHIETVLVSTQHLPDVPLEQIQQEVKSIAQSVLPEEFLSEATNFIINPSGSFVEGGPKADCGLTGRKIIADTYGGMARHGGGAFSGKDPSKVDRSVAYMARYIAKNIVAAKLAKRCEIQLAYAIGKCEPISLKIDTFNTSQVEEGILAEAVESCFNLTPYGIIQTLDLQRPIFQKTATGGHFGRNDPDFMWEKINMASTLKKKVESLLLESTVSI
ncbi:MAG: methionine adenosyltransferase [Chlamydiales bacterium]|nr:methionine adenosyltransferase [Chlamydiales bacterium]